MALKTFPGAAKIVDWPFVSFMRPSETRGLASHDWRAWRPSSQALPFLPLCRCLRQVLLHSELRNPFDQAEGDRLIKWKSQIAFLSRIAPKPPSPVSHRPSPVDRSRCDS